MEPLVPLSKREPGVYQGEPETTEVKPEETFSPHFIRTMRSDMANAIQQQHETAVSIALAEEKKRKAASEKTEVSEDSPIESTGPAPKKFGRVLIIIIILALLALAGAAYVFVLPKLSLPQFAKTEPLVPTTTREPETAPTERPKFLAASIIPAQSEKHFDLSTETIEIIASIVEGEHDAGNAPGSIKNLYVTETVDNTSSEVAASRLLAFLGAETPDILLRFLEKKFMIGFWGESNSVATPFLILKVSDYDAALAGMLEWEPNILKFMSAFFGKSIPSDTVDKFTDVIVLGRDARAFDTLTETKMIYAFADKNTIVIAGSRAALEALIPLATKK